MRADAHYVDQLAAARDQPAAGPSAGRSPDVDLGRVHRAIAEHLTTIQGAAALLAADPSDLAHGVSLDLVRAQTARALWLLQAADLLDGRYEPRRRARRTGVMLTALADRLAAECRLARVGLDLRASDWQAMVELDEHVFGIGVTGAILATAGLVDDSDGSVIRLSATIGSAGTLTADITQEELSLDEETRRRFFEPAWPDRPGGWIAGIGALAARAAAERSEGEASIEPGGRRGSTIRLTFGRS
jgi:hypothetical protein